MPRYRWIAAAVLISLSVAFAARATDGPALHVEMHDAAYRDGERFLLLRGVDRAAEDIGVARLPARRNVWATPSAILQARMDTRYARLTEQLDEGEARARLQREQRSWAKDVQQACSRGNRANDEARLACLAPHISRRTRDMGEFAGL